MKDYNNKILFAVTRAKGKSWDESKEMRSQKDWTEHAEFINKLAEDGFVVLGGPIGSEGILY